MDRDARERFLARQLPDARQKVVYSREPGRVAEPVRFQVARLEWQDEWASAAL